MPDTLAQLVRKKYPGAYDDLDDRELEQRVRAKYPGAYDDIPSTEAAPQMAPADTSGEPSTFSRWQHGIGVGAAKGVINTVAGLGDIFDAAGARLGIGNRDEGAFAAVRAMNQPTTAPERVGMGIEQAAEFVGVPGPGKVRGAKLALGMVRSGAANVGLARAQGATGGEAATAGVLGAVPVSAAMGAAGKWIGGKAKPLIRSALKPTVTAMRRVAGASVEGIDAKAGQLVSFILENRITTAEKARTIFSEAERELQRILSVKNAPTDAPQRAIRYLDALEKSASKQALPAEDVALIRKAAGEVFAGGLGQDVAATVSAQEAAGITDPAIEEALRGMRSILKKAGKADPGQPIFDDAGRRVGTRGGLSWKEYAGINRPEISDITPNRAAAAIDKDADNPTYLRLKDALRNEWEDRFEREALMDTSPLADDALSFDPAALEAPTIGGRRLRTDVSAAEAMERARANSRWDTRKAWGEQKGASKEASKTIERALRDSVKAAVPEAAPILKREGLSLRTAEALDRAEFRAANRDAVSLPAHVVAAGELARGRPPVLAFAANWLRNNQLKAGIYADTLGKAIERGDTGRVVSIMHRLGVGMTPQLLSATAGR